ncbi:MAG: MFS transporter [Candidatus Omnitrophica bacterium]|nr:MFS transporter [Candidatus Omnitrophota bacterium]
MILRALRYRNYRLFFGGQSISLVGTWMQQVAMSWLVYRLTKSAFLLGLVGFAGQIPTFMSLPFAGVFVDRWNRHRILVITQFLAMVQAFILALLIMGNAITVWHIVSLSIFLGLVNAFDAPARQAFVFELVETKEDIGNAIALNSLIFNAARLIGPFVAGILIAALGEGPCFLINGLSYLSVIAALLAMRDLPKRREAQGYSHLLKELKAGFDYAFGFPPIRSILLLLGLVSMMGVPYVILMPIFAIDILHGGAHTLGFLMSASGIGALAGAIYLVSRKTVIGFGKRIVFASGIFGLGLILFSLSNVLWLSLLLILLAGLGMIVFMASSNTILQVIVEDDKRGRVMSLYTMAFIGMVPFGSLLAGSLASSIGAPNTLMLGGISCILGSLIFATKVPYLKHMVRPIYEKEGIIREVAPGIMEKGI